MCIIMVAVISSIILPRARTRAQADARTSACLRREGGVERYIVRRCELSNRVCNTDTGMYHGETLV